MSSESVQGTYDIDFQWQVRDPFLFCAYHHDLYPKGNENFGPAESLAGRNIGQDFVVKNGYRMYHGNVVPGFPVHPHRGFETITLIQKGYIDHADSLGASGRYGAGDVQWMTAGSGLQHSEMFPLLDRDGGNDLEMFQLWINLPAKNKMVPANYKMFWAEQIPQLTLDDGKAIVKVIAGSFNEKAAISAPKNSWAFDPANQVAVWLIEIEAAGKLTLPSAEKGLNRNLFFYGGSEIKVDNLKIKKMTAANLESSLSTELENTSNETAKLLFLQGKPINEPVAQHGPFVMNHRDEIVKAIQDYQTTQFGGWQWERPDVVLGEKKERFAKHSDGRIEKPT